MKHFIFVSSGKCPLKDHSIFNARFLRFNFSAFSHVLHIFVKKLETAFYCALKAFYGEKRARSNTCVQLTKNAATAFFLFYFNQKSNKRICITLLFFAAFLSLPLKPLEQVDAMKSQTNTC